MDWGSEKTMAPAPLAVTSREVRTESTILWDQVLSLDGVSVLVVDDQEEARVLLIEELSEYGAHVTTVSSGAEALAILSLSVPKMPSENIRLESQQVNEFNFDTSFVNSEKKQLSDFRAGKISLRKIRSSS